MENIKLIKAVNNKILLQTLHTIIIMEINACLHKWFSYNIKYINITRIKYAILAA